MKRLLIILLLALVFLIILSRWHELWGLNVKPNLMIILIVHLGIFLPDWRGGIAAFFLGYLADTFSGYWLGLNITLFTADFLLITALGYLISFRFIWVRIMVVALVILLNYSLNFVILGLFHQSETLDASWWVMMGKEMLFTILLALPLLGLLDWGEKKWIASEN